MIEWWRCMENRLRLLNLVVGCLLGSSSYKSFFALKLVGFFFLQPSCTTQPYFYVLLIKSTYIKFFNCCCPSVAQMCLTLWDPQTAGHQASLDLVIDWRQSADEVIVKLHMRIGPMGLEEVNTAFTDTGCVVRLLSGQWGVLVPKCRLAKVASCSCHCTRRCLCSHGPLLKKLLGPRSWCQEKGRSHLPAVPGSQALSSPWAKQEASPPEAGLRTVMR